MGDLGHFRKPVAVASAVLPPLAQLAAHAAIRLWLPWLLSKEPRRVVIVGVNELGLQLRRQFVHHNLNTHVVASSTTANPSAWSCCAAAPCRAA